MALVSSSRVMLLYQQLFLGGGSKNDTMNVKITKFFFKIARKQPIEVLMDFTHPW